MGAMMTTRPGPAVADDVAAPFKSCKSAAPRDAIGVSVDNAADVSVGEAVCVSGSGNAGCAGVCDTEGVSDGDGGGGGGAEAVGSLPPPVR